MEQWGICWDLNTCGGLENIAKNGRVHKGSQTQGPGPIAQCHTLAFLCVCSCPHKQTHTSAEWTGKHIHAVNVFCPSTPAVVGGPLIPLCSAPCCVKARLRFIFCLCKTSCSLNRNLADFHPALFRHNVVSTCKWTVVNPPFCLHLSPLLLHYLSGAYVSVLFSWVRRRWTRSVRHIVYVLWKLRSHCNTAQWWSNMNHDQSLFLTYMFSKAYFSALLFKKYLSPFSLGTSFRNIYNFLLLWHSFMQRAIFPVEILFFVLFLWLYFEMTAWDMTGNRMREKGRCGTGRIWTPGRCSEDTASVHGVHALPTELLRCLVDILI